MLFFIKLIWIPNINQFRNCNLKTPEENEQWIYNEVSWQIVQRTNQTMCIQKLFDGYRVGNPIVLKPCQRISKYGYHVSIVVVKSWIFCLLN